MSVVQAHVPQCHRRSYRPYDVLDASRKQLSPLEDEKLLDPLPSQASNKHRSNAVEGEARGGRRDSSNSSQCRMPG